MRGMTLPTLPRTTHGRGSVGAATLHPAETLHRLTEIDKEESDDGQSSAYVGSNRQHEQ